MISALVFADGVGSKMKSKERPKQFLFAGGKTIIIHTLEHFANHNTVDNIVVICLESWIDALKQFFAFSNFNNRERIYKAILEFLDKKMKG